MVWKWPIGQLGPDPSRIPSEIKNGEDTGSIVRVFVVDAEWKTAGEHSWETEMTGMDPVKEPKALKIGHDGI